MKSDHGELVHFRSLFQPFTLSCVTFTWSFGITNYCLPLCVCVSLLRHCQNLYKFKAYDQGSSVMFYKDKHNYSLSIAQLFKCHSALGLDLFVLFLWLVMCLTDV